MTIEQALNINPKRASRKKLNEATQMLRKSYYSSKIAFERRDKSSYLLELMATRQKEGEFTPGINIIKSDRQDVEKLYKNLRDYKGTAERDERRFIIRWNVAKTSTYAGYEEYINNVATNVLGYEGYKDLSTTEQADVWDYINDIRSAREKFFKPGKGAYGSGTNIKKVTEYYNKGYTKDEAIALLTRKTTEEKLNEYRKAVQRGISVPPNIVDWD